MQVNPSPIRKTGQALYLLPVLAVLLLILLVNGYFQVQQTRERLFALLESEGQLLIRGIETNSVNLFRRLDPARSAPAGPGLTESLTAEDLIAGEDILIERLVDLAVRLDQEAARQSDNPRVLEEFRAATGLKNAYLVRNSPADPVLRELAGEFKGSPYWGDFIAGRSRLFVGRRETQREGAFRLAVGLARRFGPGYVVLGISPTEFHFWIRQVILQGMVEDFAGKGNLAYLEIRDPGGRVTASVGELESEPPQPVLWEKALSGKDPPVWWIKKKQGEFLEIRQAFQPGGAPQGTIRVGLSLQMITPIINQARKQVLLMTLGLLALGAAGFVFIFRLQNRHLQKVGEMEEQIRLQQEHSTMGKLAAGVAHEIKNPLNAIGLVAQRLQQEYTWEDPKTQGEYERFTRIIRDEISRVNRIIEQFLFVARPYKADREDLSLSEVLDYILDLLGEEFREKGITLERPGEPGLPSINGDRFQLTQAFINLVNNALESMPRGGVLKITAGEIPPKAEIEVRVQDSGSGIAPENLKRIFAHYFTTKEKGVGLGLAITQKIIEGHGGSLRIESQPDRGTTVFVRLPKKALENSA